MRNCGIRHGCVKSQQENTIGKTDCESFLLVLLPSEQGLFPLRESKRTTAVIGVKEDFTIVQ